MRLITNTKIQAKLEEIAEEINSQHDEVTLLVTLTGGVYTAIDLSKYLTIPCKLEFVKVSSYGAGEESTGIVELKYISKEKGTDLGNVIIIDDIYDTGNTMDFLVKYIKANYKFSSLKTMVLLQKPARREKELDINYTGFIIDNLFVYGYGLDLDGYDRNVPDIMVKQ